jgi:hypothetical protein
VISVANLPGSLKPGDDEARRALLQTTTLTVKGRDPIVAKDLVFVEGGGQDAGAAEARFLFPRKIAFTSDDKEIEFATKFGKTAVKTRFNLKYMVIDGKLGL